MSRYVMGNGKGSASEPSMPPAPGVDLRGLRPIEARARAFGAFFKVKPGQRAILTANSSEVEREIQKWISETGHRLLKHTKGEENGATVVTFELIKMEARR